MRGYAYGPEAVSVVAAAVLLALVGCDEGSSKPETSSGAKASAPRKGESKPGQTKPNKGEGDSAPELPVDERKRFSAKLGEMTDEQYPDNPNIGHRSELHGEVAYEKLALERQRDYRFDIRLVPEGDEGPVIELSGIDLSVYTPRAPEWIREDEYLTYIGIINQEWNRQQIRYSAEHFDVESGDPQWAKISRVDIARNCLNAKLWEVIAYREENGRAKVFYHGWFDFPEPLYAAMFEDQNGVPYDEYEKPLEKWVDPENKKVDLSTLRKRSAEQKVPFTVRNDTLYRLVGTRKKKYENIVNPKEPETIKAMLEDSTTFASFRKPGYYDTGMPRETELGRLRKLEQVELRKTKPEAIDGVRHELMLRFHDGDGDRTTHLILGGLDLGSLPSLKETNHPEGYKMPMGIANHTFYATYEEAKERPVGSNPYFGMLTNSEHEWIDSHHVGIDGPLMFWDAEDNNLLHLFVLSYERHAFVGHYELEMPETVRET